MFLREELWTGRRLTSRVRAARDVRDGCPSHPVTLPQVVCTITNVVGQSEVLSHCDLDQFPSLSV